MAASAVLVTRPAGQGDSLCQAIAGRGRPVHQLPLLELQPLPALSAQERARVLALDEFQHIIFISANAVRFGMAVIEDHWPQLPVGLHWYAVGDGTARALAGHGVSAEVPGLEMSSEGLLQLPGLSRVEGHRVLLVKGEGGRGLLAGELARRGAQVETLACYRRCAPRYAGGEFVAALQRWQIGIILISSGEGLENMLALLDPAETSKLQSVTLLLPSARVAETAAAAGFRHRIVADNASDEAMLRALEQWQSGSGED
ncbi:uroporphyrinogen-III synthase [Kineobactrum salinum]|uniref:Uroporphyrinogen-III synthase n=1 Tax=Kineobactrum salinum TaxID=2708301 RepID=A0A6C0U0E8_9GAMM|nr:uroporphyrinogen-III synthase [Kineobactrum salinum]QIB65253.1 uroporphyrinogen-III synthase [Kineobactrum salinum]